VRTGRPRARGARPDRDGVPVVGPRLRLPVARLDRDLAASAVGGLTFSVALGIATVALPLLALDAGYSKSAVGLLTAVSAVSQMGVRMGLAWLMRRYPDWVLVFGAGGLLAISCGLVAWSAALVPFVLCELLQGAARGCFWTGSQTHVVRGKGSSVGRLAMVNLVASVGQLLGPVLAGVVASRSIALALVMAAAVALVCMLPPVALDRLPPFAPPKDRPKGLIWRRPGVDAGCWASLTAGAWRGLLSSYVPVALDRAGQSLPLIGLLVSVANGANIAGAALVARVRGRTLVRAMTISMVASGAGVAVVALLAGSAPLAALVLAASGLGAGALQTLGPALASDIVHPQERGDAIAATGTFRAAALFASPLAVAGLLSSIALGPAMLIAGLLITLPALTTRGLRRARPVTEVEDGQAA
jgi:MFS family permease